MIRMFIWFFILFIFAGCSKSFPEVEKDKEIILVRKIGHEIMKYARDSTSALRPVQEVGHRNYLLEFNTPFSFLSDSVIHIINREVENVGKLEYVVKVHSCDSKDLVFSYYISPTKNNSLASCMGRTQGKDCYIVELKFLDEENENALGWWLLIIPIIGFYWIYKSRNGKNDILEEAIVEEGVRIGRFTFDFEGQVLQDDTAKQTLTYKESKVMKVLSDNINQVVEREELSRLVWEEDGIVVGRSLDMFISKLRKKLNGDESVEIKNIHGIGYKLMVS